MMADPYTKYLKSFSERKRKFIKSAHVIMRFIIFSKNYISLCPIKPYGGYLWIVLY